MRFFKLNSPRWPYLLFLTGVCTITLRLLLDSSFGQSALVYIAVPFAISFLLYHFVPRPHPKTRSQRFDRHILDATIIFFATSAFLFEGFICVLMFLPIYYLSILIGYAINSWGAGANNRSKLRISILPVLVGIMALEGVSASTSFNRDNTVTRTITVDATVEELKVNMAKPISFKQDRGWFISIFPLPVKVSAGSLSPGDVHTLDFVYNRWFVTNTHKGTMKVFIEDVSDNYVRTRIEDRSSYLSKYLTLEGTEVYFTPREDGRTDVTLSVHYQRELDPAWYFGPMQRYAVRQSADYLLTSVIARDHAYE